MRRGLFLRPPAAGRAFYRPSMLLPLCQNNRQFLIRLRHEE
nr:MAG TPA: hypothetical protein [Caudoviricetes sp.]